MVSVLIVVRNDKKSKEKKDEKAEKSVEKEDYSCVCSQKIE